MGSDMSRPKNRRLQKIGEIDGLYSKSAIYRDPTGNCGCGCGTMGGFNPCMPTCSPMPLCQPANLNLNLAGTPQTTRHYYPSHYTMMPAEPMNIQCVVNSSHRKSLPMECLDMSPNTSGSMLALQPQPQPQQPSFSTCRSTNRCNNVVDMSPPCPSTPCHRSRCSSPITASTTISTTSPPCHQKPVYYETTDCRQPRYRTVKPHMMSRRAQLDDEIYCSDRSRGGGGSTCGEGSMSSSSGSGRHFTITKTYHQPMVYDEVEKNVRLPAEADMIPTDRIYEIRKEKIMIKADRNSSLSPVPHGAAIHHHHPPHHHAPPPPSSLRSKSSDRYIDVPKSVRIVDEFGRPASYETDCEESFAPPRVHNSRLKSRSGYVINSDYETTSKSYLENYIETNTKVINPPSGLIESAVLNSAIKRAAPPTSNSNNCNEIIYVPMVKEEFIKRESSKHCHQPPLPSFEPADVQKSNQNANQKFWQAPPVNPKTTTNKIIIKEISPLNQFAKNSTANLVSSKTTTTTSTNATNTSNTQPPKKSTTLFNSDSFFAPRKSILKNTFQSSSQQQIQKQTDLEEDEGEEIVVNNMRNSEQLHQHQQQVDQMIVNVTNNNALRNSSSYSNTNLNGDSHRKSSSNLLNSNNNSNNSVSYGIIKEGKFFNINDAALL